ncbi:uncharacterized protein LOC110855788 [Folsomia candida]|uniref:Uncharacterized protein n=1 Tax=Folsomia candida TaxID=158441 RepID=A0A226DR57_FOLCA|nr:uncharacterized protein LOC110855788 [Folsomia candida]OXA47683.1 hypothetical protein Fcan01_17654 [Folsomia candida]
MESRQNAEAKERPSNPRRLRRITKTWEIGKKSTAQHDAWIDNEITAAYRVYRDRCTALFPHAKNPRCVTNTRNGDEFEAREQKILGDVTSPTSTSGTVQQPHILVDSIDQVPTEGPLDTDDMEMHINTVAVQGNVTKTGKSLGTETWMKTRTKRWIELLDKRVANLEKIKK